MLLPISALLFAHKRLCGKQRADTNRRVKNLFFTLITMVDNHALSINYLGKYSIVGKSLQEQTGHYA
jgi:hypothetical protein